MRRPYTPWQWWYRFWYGRPVMYLRFSLCGPVYPVDSGMAAAICLAADSRTWAVTARGHMFWLPWSEQKVQRARIQLDQETIVQLRELLSEWRDGKAYGFAAVPFACETLDPVAPQGWLVIRDGCLTHALLWETRKKKREETKHWRGALRALRILQTGT